MAERVLNIPAATAVVTFQKPFFHSINKYCKQEIRVKTANAVIQTNEQLKN